MQQTTKMPQFFAYCTPPGESLADLEGVCGSTGVVPVTGEDLLSDDGTGRPSQWLWALWVLHGEDLYVDRYESRTYQAYTHNRFLGTGATAAEAMVRALFADTGRELG